MKHISETIETIQKIGLSFEEATVFLELVREPCSHLKLSNTTGINRTKVYRVVQRLERLGLVVRQTDDRGSFYTAADPQALAMLVIDAEERVMQQRGALQKALPHLRALRDQGNSLFATRSYDGAEGLKQMCWHELQAKDAIYVFGGARLEDLIPSRYWSERHRARSSAAGYHIYEIVNHLSEVTRFTKNSIFLELYQARVLPIEVIRFENQTVVYNDAVAIYHWRDDQKSGVEIINQAYADMMRQMFNHYWAMAIPVTNVGQ